MKAQYTKPEMTVVCVSVEGTMLTTSPLVQYDEEQEGNEWGE